MLRIKLRRAGKKNQPFFKMAVIEKKSPPKGGRPVEVVGFYNPLTKEKGLKQERIKHWLSVGAQPSDAVYNMLVTAGIVKGDKIGVHKKAKAEQKKPVQAAVGAVIPESPPQSFDKDLEGEQAPDGPGPAGQAETGTQETVVETSAEKQEQETEKAETPKPEEKKVEEVRPEQNESKHEKQKTGKAESKQEQKSDEGQEQRKSEQEVEENKGDEKRVDPVK